MDYSEDPDDFRLFVSDSDGENISPIKRKSMPIIGQNKNEFYNAKIFPPNESTVSHLKNIENNFENNTDNDVNELLKNTSEERYTPTEDIFRSYSETKGGHLNNNKINSPIQSEQNKTNCKNDIETIDINKEKEQHSSCENVAKISEADRNIEHNVSGQNNLREITKSPLIIDEKNCNSIKEVGLLNEKNKNKISDLRDSYTEDESAELSIKNIKNLQNSENSKEKPSKNVNNNTIVEEESKISSELEDSNNEMKTKEESLIAKITESNHSENTFNQHNDCFDQLENQNASEPLRNNENNISDSIDNNIVTLNDGFMQNDENCCKNNCVNLNESNNENKTVSETEDHEGTINTDKNDMNSDDELTLPKKKKNTKLGIIDSDSEDDDELHNWNAADDKTLESNVLQSDDESNSWAKQKKRMSSLIDSDTDDDNDETKIEDYPRNNITENSNEMVREKNSQNDLKAIKSESQRLVREKQISVPYHKPKQHTLKEFLTRKTINLPLIMQDNNKLQKKPLKMSSAELKEFARRLEERAKEAEEFYKDESNEILTEMIEDNSEMKMTSETETEKETAMVDVISEKNSEDKPVGTDSDKVILMDTEVSLLDKEEHGKIDEINCNTTKADTTEKEIVLLCEQKNPPESGKLSISKMLPEILNMGTIFPFLQGNSEMIIDLESNEIMKKEKSGPEKLLERLLSTSAKVKRNSHKHQDTIDMDENNETTDKPSEKLSDAANRNQEQLTYLKIKEKLKKQITLRRKEEFLKKIDTNKSKARALKLDDEENILDEEFELNSEESCVEEYSDDEENKDKKNICEIKADDVEEDEADEKNLEYDEESVEDMDEEYPINKDDEEYILLRQENKKNKSIIIEDEEDIDSTVVDSEKNTENQNTSIDTLKNRSDNLIWNSIPYTNNDKCSESELMELCSGNFEQSQNNFAISQVLKTQQTQSVKEHELLELCSGSFPETQCNKNEDDFEASEEENVDTEDNLNTSDEEENIVNKRKKLVKKKSTKKLQFSDDEEDEENENIQGKVQPNNGSDDGKILNDTNENVDGIENSDREYIDEERKNIEDDELVETYIDYDSEENEIEVKMTKSERKEKAHEFLENEAELSESDWGSADEDEKNLDKYDIELGDEDNFDKDKLQEELEKIHVRRLLDDDTRDVKKLQEMFFESEETDGVGRQRQFKWKNIDNAFSLDDVNRSDVGNDANSEEDDEELWRKKRFEREMLIKEKVVKNMGDIKSNMNSPLVENNITVSSTIKKKINILKPINSDTSQLLSTNEKSFLITKSANKTNARGSFLVRDTETLSKLSCLLKPSASDPDEALGGVKSVKARNFIFSTLNRDEISDQNNRAKRKSENVEKCSQYLNENKKLKLTFN